MKLPFLRTRNATAAVDDTAPDVPVNCTIVVPTSEGNIGIYLSNKEICDQYASTGHFCALPHSFRDAWSHVCPSPASVYPRDLPLASKAQHAHLQTSPLPTPISSLPPSSLPTLHHPPQNVWTKLFDHANTTRTPVLKNPTPATQAWQATAGVIVAFGFICLVYIGVMLCCPSCCSCLRRRRAAPQMRRP
ncbi:hypothetical protein F5Y02DRAFT_430097 [Annulohypoxylon stygium]|nr:hypothetical protein F5Y02DRAFT_430097 [Annulohypoxylon stygium]